MIEIKSRAFEQLVYGEELTRCLQRVMDRADLGFKEVTERDWIWESSARRAQEILAGALTGGRSPATVGIVGIGGSHLGIEVIERSLLRDGDSLPMIFFDNLDPVAFECKWRDLEDPRSTHWVIISKSGTTLETLYLANMINQRLANDVGCGLADCCTVVTETRDNPLYDWARENRVEVLELPKDVGGRFSVLTPVGVFPAALLGLDILKMKEGAQWAIDHPGLVIELSDQFLQSMKNEHWVSMFWIYSDQLYKFGEWWQQLWAESLAKKRTLDGGSGPDVSTPIACRGANDQHSLLQQVVEGRRDKFLCFFTVESNFKKGAALERDIFGAQRFCEGRTMGQVLNAQANANVQVLKSEGVPCLDISIETMNEFTLGALFMTFELVIATLGEKLQINTFDQPGVEQGKIVTKSMLQS